jgi:biopolymer transport protein ExbD
MFKRPLFASPGVSLDMTPLIDIVFQLLAFFILTLRVLSHEGDLAIRMPLAADPGQPPPVTFLPPLQIKLTALADGSLAEIRLNNQSVASMPTLRQRIVEIIGNNEQAAAELEADLHCDAGLAYQHTIAAVTAISGRRDSAGHIQPLVRKVRFK